MASAKRFPDETGSNFMWSNSSLYCYLPSGAKPIDRNHVNLIYGIHADLAELSMGMVTKNIQSMRWPPSSIALLFLARSPCLGLILLTRLQKLYASYTPASFSRSQIMKLWCKISSCKHFPSFSTTSAPKRALP